MLDITTIILTYNEELHIRRCLENVCSFSKKVYVVDSPSTDRTVEICKEFSNVEVVVHEYPGNQAAQFNWALDNINIETEWVLRLDADEYVTEDLKDELIVKLSGLSQDVSAVVIPLGRAFMGRLLKHSIVNEVKMIRLFRNGKVRYEQRLMDEHLEVLEGKIVSFENKFIDDNLLSVVKFIDKHNNYSSREAAVILDAKYGLYENENLNNREYAKDVAEKRKQKAKYASLPLFWRSFAYFIYRYIFKLGFLDGKEGFLWDFLQGWWYRTLVDAKVLECHKACNIKNKTTLTIEERERMKMYIKDVWKITL